MLTKTSPPARPKLSPAAARIFFGVAAYARRYCRHPDCLPSAASDHMDGRYLSSDPGVMELVGKGILEEVPVEKSERWPPKQRVTWHLTPYACKVLLTRRNRNNEEPT